MVFRARFNSRNEFRETSETSKALADTKIREPNNGTTMSFGFSVGDFIAVIKLADGLRKRFIEAPKQYEDIQKE
jgi:hypothetical protein